MITFIVGNESTINHFSQIWKNLDKNEFQLLFTWENLDGIEKYNLNKLNIIYCNDIKEQIFDVSLSCWPSSEVFESNIYKKNFRKNILYSLIGAEDEIAKSDHLYKYDHIIAFGDYSYNYLKNFFVESKIEIIGYPRFDYIDYDNFPKKSKSLLIHLYDFFAKKTKPNILYMPSHGQLGSFKKFSEYLLEKNFLNYFNFSCKPHDDLFKSDLDTLNKLKRKNVEIVDEYFFQSEKFKKIDLIISDYGGSSLIPVLFKKPGLILTKDKNLNLQEFLIKKGVANCKFNKLNIFKILKALNKKNLDIHENLNKYFYKSKSLNGKKIAQFLTNYIN